MTQIIKNFIEENIDYIENNKWYMFFTNWLYYRYKDFPDNGQYDELLSILEHAGIDVEKQSIDARKAVIITRMRGLIDAIVNDAESWLNKDETHVFIVQQYLIEDLESVLGLTRDEIKWCADEAAKAEQCGRSVNSSTVTYSKKY